MRDVWSAAGAVIETAPPAGSGDLASIHTHLFSEAALPQRDSDGSFEFFSAPGEGRECVEIARRVLREARRGVAFDEMAVLVRAPAHYLGLLEHALERAGVPAYFERGTRRPHAGGRAFLALLACAAEGLSANRFAEYLSLGQIPAGGRPAGRVGAAGRRGIRGRRRRQARRRTQPNLRRRSSWPATTNRRSPARCAPPGDGNGCWSRPR